MSKLDKYFFIKAIDIVFLVIATYIAMIQPTVRLFAWIYLPCLTIYEVVMIWVSIKDWKERFKKKEN